GFMKRFISIVLIILTLFTFCSCGVDTNINAAAEIPELEVHFIDVGQADCALLMCGGENLLIDGGNAADSSLIYSYLKKYGVDYLDYVIATHPHEDHIGGIPGALSYAKAGVVYSPVTSSDNSYFKKLTAKLEEMGVGLTVPEVGGGFDLGGAKVTFLGPVELVSDENENSIVCKVRYGDVSFLFTGDAGKQSETLMLDNGEDVAATVLKVGHHGSDTATGYRFLREVNPVYAVISTEQDSQYGHPHENLLSRLNDAGVMVCRTDMNGTIIFTTDGTTLSVSPEKGAIGQSTALPDSEDEGDVMYIGNSSSKKYHLPTCRSLPEEKNRIYFYSLEEAINSGFAPCGLCKP
ncbi:MAG: ComEC/Rec2 family competence protein, partial [Clostridia bacterium]